MRRFLTLLVCFGVLCGFVSRAQPAEPPGERVVAQASAIPSAAWRAELLQVTTTTTAPPPPTTTSTLAPPMTAPPRTVPPRASRSAVTPRPTAPPAVAAPPAEGCMRHGAKSYAEMQSCWGGLVARYPWPAAKVWSVMYCESKGDPWARNRSGATGLMQVMGGTTDPAGNIAQAFSMWRSRGWQPWVCA